MHRLRDRSVVAGMYHWRELAQKGIDAGAEADEPPDRANSGVRGISLHFNQATPKQSANALLRAGAQRLRLWAVGDDAQLLLQFCLQIDDHRCSIRLSGEIPRVCQGKNRFDDRKSSQNEESFTASEAYQIITAEMKAFIGGLYRRSRLLAFVGTVEIG